METPSSPNIPTIPFFASATELEQPHDSSSSSDDQQHQEEHDNINNFGLDCFDNDLEDMSFLGENQYVNWD